MKRARESSSVKRKTFKRARTAPSGSISRGRRRIAARNARTGGFLGQELKYYDTSFGPTPVVATITSAETDPLTVLTLSAPAQGDGAQNRDGKQIIIKNINVRGEVHRENVSAQTTVPGHMVVVVALVLDQQSNGAQLNSEDVYNQPGVGNTTNAVRNLEYSKRFKVLAYERLEFDSPPFIWNGSNMNVGGSVKKFEWNKKVNIPVNFTTGTTAGISNVVDNSLHVVAWATIATTPDIAYLEYAARIRFVG